MYTVLHIEHSDFFRKMVKNVLSSKGYNYIYAEDFKEAYEIIYEYDVDLIITSLIPEGDSIENFIETINKSNKGEIPIFVVTGNSMDEDKKRILNLGVSDYILKDHFMEEISKHVNSVFQVDQYMKDLRESKIAIVDDSSVESTIEEDMLKKHGIKNIDYYKSGNELLSSGKKYDLYLVDLVLKNEFGKNIIMHIRRNNITSSIIAVTGIHNSKTLSSILNTGADDFITKPIDEELFIAKLRSNIRVYSMNKKFKEILKEIK